MFDILPKTRWAPLEASYETSEGGRNERNKTEFEQAFDGSIGYYNVAEAGVLRFGSINNLPIISRPLAWNLPSRFAPIASFPSVASACWFLTHLREMSIYQTHIYASKPPGSTIRPSSQTYQLDCGFVAYNELKSDLGYPADIGSGGTAPKPHQGWEDKRWYWRQFMGSLNKTIASTGGPDGSYPEGTWIVAPSRLRLAYPTFRGDYFFYEQELEIFGIVVADDKAWLIGHANFFPDEINTQGREGCVFASTYFELAKSTRAEISIPTPMGEGKWYYQQFSEQSTVYFQGQALQFQTGAKSATINFTFEI